MFWQSQQVTQNETFVEKINQEPKVLEPLPTVEVIGPMPTEILEKSGSTFYFLIYKNADSISLSDSSVTLNTSNSLRCEYSLVKISEAVYGLLIKECSGEGNLRLEVIAGTSKNKDGIRDSDPLTSESLQVLKLQEKIRTVKVEVPVLVRIPVPVSTSEPEASPTPSPQVNIPHHEIVIPRPVSGLFYITTDMSSYYFKSDDSNETLKITRPLGGHRFVSIRYIPKEKRDKKLLMWRRSDLNRTLFEPDESGVFKIDLINLSESKHIDVIPIYQEP